VKDVLLKRMSLRAAANAVLIAYDPESDAPDAPIQGVSRQLDRKIKEAFGETPQVEADPLPPPIRPKRGIPLSGREPWYHSYRR